MLEEYLEPFLRDAVPDHITHIGFIASDYDGNFVVSASPDSKTGATATFPKERITAGTDAVAILRWCLAQYEDPHVEGIYPVPLLGVTPTSTTFYFAGLVNREIDHWHTEKGQLAWHSPDRVIELLKASKNPASKSRDLAVFEAVSQMCLSPHHRVMGMLHELHKIGFERLRGPSHSWNVSWRMFVVPAAWTLKNHGHQFRDPRGNLAPLPMLRIPDAVDFRFMYAGAQSQQPFGWTDLPFASPRELAERFLRECPDIAMLGWGPDKQYVEWYERLLEAIKPYHLYNSEGDCYGSDEHIFIKALTPFRLPPPGHTELSEVDAYRTRFCKQAAEDD